MTDIDFETTSEIEIDDAGAWAYSLHPSTDVLCIKAITPDGRVITWAPGLPFPEELRHGPVKAHNWLFEYSIWTNILVPRYGFPPKDKSLFDCSMAQAFQATYPGKLETLGKALNLDIQKDMANRRVMLKLMRKPWKATPTVKDWENLFSYCQTDVEVEIAAAKNLPPLQECEREIFELDKVINLRGIPIDMNLVRSAKNFIEQFEVEQLAHFQTLTGLESPGQVDKLLQWSNERGARLGSLQAAEVDAALKFLEGDVKEALEIRRMLGLSSVKKIYAMEAAAYNGRIVGCLQYHAASTGRWGGRLIQPQNLPSKNVGKDVDYIIELILRGDYEFFKSKYPNVFNAISSALRGFICAPAGKKLIGGDFNAIEARGVFWLSGCETGLELYRGEGLVYEAMAGDIFERRITKADKMERNLGKQAVLGCGYGMGVEKFIATCLGYGIEITPELGARAVNLYRTKFKEVRSFWYDVQRAAITAVQSGRTEVCGRVKWRCEGGFLKCRLPSGRILFYPKPFITQGEKGPELNYWGVNAKKQWAPQRSWGGVLTENCFGGKTPVLTLRGIVPITSVLKSDLIFDGHDFVAHEGVISRGVREVIEWHGTVVTPDHLIQVGRLWRAVIAWGGRSSLRPQKWALKLAESWLLKRELETTKTPWLNVNAEKNFRSIIAACSAQASRNVETVRIKLPAKNGLFGMNFLKAPNFIIHGAGAIREYFTAAITQMRRPIQITAGGALRYLGHGSKIETYFLSTLKRCQIMMIYLWTSIESITTGIMSLRICGSLLGSKIQTIGEQLKKSFFGVKKLLFQSFGRSIAQNGEAQTPLLTTKDGGEVTTKFSRFTAPVFDIKNCGPRNQFMIFTDSGPVIAHNCTQAIARDLMTNAMKNLEREGYPLILTVHDETLSEVDSGFGSAEEYSLILNKLPDWARDFPIASESWEGPRFRK